MSHSRIQRVLGILCVIAIILAFFLWPNRAEEQRSSTFDDPQASTEQSVLLDPGLIRVEIAHSAGSSTAEGFANSHNGEIIVINSSRKESGNLLLRNKTNETSNVVRWQGLITTLPNSQGEWTVSAGDSASQVVVPQELRIEGGAQTVCYLYDVTDCNIKLLSRTGAPLVGWSVAVLPYLDLTHPIPNQDGMNFTTDQGGIVSLQSIAATKALVVATDCEGSAMGAIVDFALSRSPTLVFDKEESQSMRLLSEELGSLTSVSLGQVQTRLTLATNQVASLLEFRGVGWLDSLVLMGPDIQPIDLPPFSQMPGVVKLRVPLPLEIHLGEEWVARGEPVTVFLRSSGQYEASEPGVIYDYDYYQSVHEMDPARPLISVDVPAGLAMEVRAVSKSAESHWAPFVANAGVPIVLGPPSLAEPLEIQISGDDEVVLGARVLAVPQAAYVTDLVVEGKGESWIVQHPEKALAIEVASPRAQRLSLLPVSGFGGSLGGSLNLNLEPSLTISGTIQSLHSETPLPAWYLEFRAKGRSGQATSHQGWLLSTQPRSTVVVSGPDGRFQITSLGPGSYQVIVRPQVAAMYGGVDYLPFNLSLPIAGELLFRVPEARQVSVSAVDEETGRMIPSFAIIAENLPVETKITHTGLWQGVVFTGCSYRMLAFGYQPTSLLLAESNSEQIKIRLKPIDALTLVNSVPEGYKSGEVGLRLHAVRKNGEAFDPLGFYSDIQIIQGEQEVLFPADSEWVYLEVLSPVGNKDWRVTPSSVLWRPKGVAELKFSVSEEGS